MPRLSYANESEVSDRALVDRIKERRGGRLLKMDRIMLHSPPLAAGWNAFFKAVIGEVSLSRKDSQFVMCVIAALNGADYEMASHAPQFLAAGGTQAQLDALRDVDAAAADAALFTARESAILRLCLEMTRNVDVSGACFAQARRAFPDERQLLELITTIAAYNMVSRLVVALDIHTDDQGL